MKSDGATYGGGSGAGGARDVYVEAGKKRAGMSSSRSRVEVWGVLNVTPDSFSDGGKFESFEAALAGAERMVEAGADVIDVGGASSRPAGGAYGAGAGVVSPELELARVLPVVEALVARGGVRVSVDTTSAIVAERTVRAGAEIVNDVSCAAESELLRVVADAGVDLVVMHTRGRGQVAGENVVYADLVAEVRDELAAAVARARAAGVARERIWVDPGLGFAKSPEQSLALLQDLRASVPEGHRVLVGASRKAFLGRYAPDASRHPPRPQDRLGASVAAALVAARVGAHAVRVHDVYETRQALAFWGAAEVRA